MGHDRDYRDLVLAWSVAPEYSERCGSPVLRIRFKNLFAVRTRQARGFVALKTGMAGIVFQETQGLSHGFEALSGSGGFCQSGERSPCSIVEEQMKRPHPSNHST